MESDAIKKICQEREITTLIHFTSINNLARILQHGILSRKILEEGVASDSRYQFNDLYRLDGFRSAICLSITFPNYQMFYKYNREDRGKWVVIQLNASLLWELDCAFCKENAASNKETCIPIDTRRQTTSLERMFESYGDLHRSTLSIPDNYPTHPQAEVLVFERIDPKYIYAVDFKTQYIADEWINVNGYPTFGKAYYGDRYFCPRKDYQHWNTTKQNTQDTIVEMEMM